MKVLGKKIRERRKEKKLSQIGLAEGICTQATVSKIENKNRCESLDVFSSICSKLGLSVFECLEETYEQEIDRILTNVEYLCEQVRHREAYELIYQYNLEGKFISQTTKIKFLYYRGLTSLLGNLSMKKQKNI
ncbi:helix-turn-helix domain-containing protein [Enterococcus rivorum]|uniref:helix-turn-helix domain-containing protein n=1 Tax=Enterococcus rivorum TaxID=762845 RepID=UPI003633BAB4